MALQNAQGHYLKIETVLLEQKIALCHIYKDVDVRQNPSQFDTPIEQTFDISSKLKAEGESFVSTGNLFNDVIQVGYAALKNEPPFNGATGETWTDC